MSRFGFFKRGFIAAYLSKCGTHPMDREPFIMSNIGGPSTGSSSFSSLVGIGFSMQFEGLEAITIFINVSRDNLLSNHHDLYKLVNSLLRKWPVNVLVPTEELFFVYTHSLSFTLV